MKHRTTNRRFLAALGVCGLLQAVACTYSDPIGRSGDRDGGNGGMGSSGGTTWAKSDASVADGLGGNTAHLDAPPICATLTCFSACEQQIPIAPIDPPKGFVPVQPKSYAYETFSLGSDMVLGTGRSFAEIHKIGDLSLVANVPLPGSWSYESTAVVGTTAVVRDGYVNLSLLDLKDLAAPRATTWLPSAGDPVGSWQGKLVLNTGHGVSFVDVSNPLAPVEAFCLPDVSAEFISGDTLVSSSARVYRLDPALHTASLLARIPMGDTRVFSMDGLRLVVPAAGGNGWDIGLYDLAGDAPVEIARHEQRYHPYLWATSGFFFEAESSDLSKTIAYDMRGAFEPYRVSAIAGNECLRRLDALDGSAAWVISAWLPGMRYPPEALPPVTCPAEDPIGDARGVGALSPDGHTLILPSYEGWVLRDLDTGVDRIVGGGSRYPDFVGWSGDRIVAIDKLLSVEFSSSSATIYDAANPQNELAAIRDLNPSTEWLGASGGQIVGFNSSYSPALVLLDPLAATLVTKPIGLTTSGSNTSTSYAGYLWKDRLVVFRGTEAVLFDLDGIEQGRLALPSFIAGARSFLLSDLGWFATTDAGEVLRFDPASFTVEVGVAGCVGCWLLGADSERVYVQATGPDALGPLAPPPGSAFEAFRNYDYMTYRELRAYAITKGGYPLVGRYPLTKPSLGRLLIGSKLALVGDGALLLAAPPSAQARRIP